MFATFLRLRQLPRWQYCKYFGADIIRPFLLRKKETYDIKLSVDNYELYSDRECTNKIEETDLDKILDQEYFVKISSIISSITIC